MTSPALHGGSIHHELDSFFNSMCRKWPKKLQNITDPLCVELTGVLSIYNCMNASLALVHVMTWRLLSARPLPRMQIYVTRLQWVKENLSWQQPEKQFHKQHHLQFHIFIFYQKCLSAILLRYCYYSPIEINLISVLISLYENLSHVRVLITHIKYLFHVIASFCNINRDSKWDIWRPSH